MPATNENSFIWRVASAAHRQGANMGRRAGAPALGRPILYDKSVSYSIAGIIYSTVCKCAGVQCYVQTCGLARENLCGAIAVLATAERKSSLRRRPGPSLCSHLLGDACPGTACSIYARSAVAEGGGPFIVLDALPACSGVGWGGAGVGGASCWCLSGCEVPLARAQPAALLAGAVPTCSLSSGPAGPALAMLRQTAGRPRPRSAAAAVAAPVGPRQLLLLPLSPPPPHAPPPSPFERARPAACVCSC